VESPQIVCPASFSRNNDAGQCSAVVTYVAPVGTDNCQPQTSLASGLGSGGNFTVGAHNETYTVVDQVSFSNSCTFTILLWTTKLLVSSVPATCPFCQPTVFALPTQHMGR